MQVNLSGFLSLDYHNSCFLELLLMTILWIQLLDNAEVENQENTPVLVAYSHFDIHAHDLIQSLKIGLTFKKQRESSFLLLANAILFFFFLQSESSHHPSCSLSFRFYSLSQKSHIIIEEIHLTSLFDIILKKLTNQLLFVTINSFHFRTNICSVNHIHSFLLCNTFCKSCKFSFEI